MSKGGFDAKTGAFSAGSGGAGSNADDLVISNSFSKMGLKTGKAAAADGDEDDEDDEEGDTMATLPRAVLKRVLALRNMYSAHEQLDADYKKERIALEQKYYALREAQYAERHQIITGEVEPEVDTTQLADVPVEKADEEDTKGIPDFWSQVFLQHSSTAEIITEEDMPLLAKLSNVTCTYDETYTCFTLHFHFEENDYFSNKVLTKKYQVSPDLLDEAAPALSLNEGTEIHWKAGKNLTVTEIRKKQKAKSGKHKGQVRTVITHEPKRSFFNYFSPPKPEDEDEEEEDEEDDDGIKLSTEEDYDIGHTIRTILIPAAIMWYTGEAGDDEDDEDEDEDDEDEDEEDENDDEESEDDEVDDLVAAKKKSGGKKSSGARSGANKGGFAAAGGGAAAGGDGEKTECKQN